MRACVAALADRRLLAWAVVWAVASLVAFGLVAAAIPNPSRACGGSCTVRSARPA
jgi:hypothetical protein